MSFFLSLNNEMIQNTKDFKELRSARWNGDQWGVPAPLIHNSPAASPRCSLNTKFVEKEDTSQTRSEKPKSQKKFSSLEQQAIKRLA